MNIFTMLGHHPKLLKRFNLMGGFLLTGLDDHDWSDDDRDLIVMADELCADDCVSDITFARLRQRWSEAELVELVICAGFYRLVSGFLNTMGVPLDEGVPGWPVEASST